MDPAHQITKYIMFSSAAVRQDLKLHTVMFLYLLFGDIFVNKT